MPIGKCLLKLLTCYNSDVKMKLINCNFFIRDVHTTISRFVIVIGFVQ